MLQRLSVENIALIQRLDLEFDSGLTILTGETGAGKSVIIDALALALGARAEAGLIRTGADRAVVVAAFQPPPDHASHRWLREQELDEDGGGIILRRVLSRNGPSRAFVNETQVPLATLARLGDLLVEIHGQHDHQTLLNPATHLAILDAFAAHPERTAATAGRCADWRAVRDQLETLRRQTRDAAERHAFLSFQLAELDAAGVVPGEQAELEARRGRLAHASRLAEAAQEAWERLSELPVAAVTTSGQAAAALEEVAELDPALAAIAEAVRSLHYELDDAAQRVRHYRDGLETDPRELEQLDERLDLIRRLSRKHHCEADRLPELAEQWRQEIDTIDHAGTHEQRLEKELAAALAAFLEQARILGAARRKAADTLTATVETQLAELHMANTRFAVTLPARSGDPDPRGLEEAAFQVSTNPGEPVKPLRQVASGGELSRITLALRVALADRESLSTLIFDEVDVGVGGRVAAAIGSKLARVAAGRQVLAITHLPQVAAWGGAHLKVAKETTGNRPVIAITPLDADERVEELARMLAGDQVTAAARRNAVALLDGARETVSGENG